MNPFKPKPQIRMQVKNAVATNNNNPSSSLLLSSLEMSDEQAYEP